LLAADVASFSGVRVFDVRTAMVTKIKDLVQMLIKIFNLDFEPVFGAEKAYIRGLEPVVGFVLMFLALTL
jgi:hypothetical protein